MSESDLSTLPQRMRYAADAIDEFNKLLGDLYNSDCHWRPSELRREAGHLEAEEREAAERDALVAWPSFSPSDWFRGDIAGKKAANSYQEDEGDE